MVLVARSGGVGELSSLYFPDTMSAPRSLAAAGSSLWVTWSWFMRDILISANQKPGDTSADQSETLVSLTWHQMRETLGVSNTLMSTTWAASSRWLRHVGIWFIPTFPLHIHLNSALPGRFHSYIIDHSQDIYSDDAFDAYSNSRRTLVAFQQQLMKKFLKFSEKFFTM